MAKRFIDTEIFQDKWFLSLSKDEKLFWIYLITNCNHAGIIELNEPLIEFLTGITDLERVIEGLANRLIRVKDSYYFLPKFLEYQYPNFPNSKVRSQNSAIEILKKFDLWDIKKETLSKGLAKGYGNEHGNDNGYEHGKDVFSEIENHQWFESLYRMFPGKFTMDEIIKYWESFKKECNVSDDLNRTSTDYKRHFLNILKKKNDKELSTEERIKKLRKKANESN